MSRDWTERWPDLLAGAGEEARRLKHGHLGVEHVFLALLRDSHASALLEAQGLEPAKVREALRREAGLGLTTSTVPLEPTPRLTTILERAEALGPEPGTTSVLQALLDEGQSLPARYLRSLGQDPATLLTRQAAAADTDATHTSLAPVHFPTPTLDEWGRDLTNLARLGELGDAVGREKEIRQVATILTRTQKASPLLLGEPGVGKTAIVEGLAVLIAREEGGPFLAGRRIVELDVAGLLAGTSHRGEFEQRVRQVLKEAAQAPDVVLFIDEIHTLTGAGMTSSGALDAAGMFKPALARGEIRCIGATTQAEYARYIRKDPALERRFSPIVVEELGEEETLSVLRHVSRRILAKHARHGRTLALAPEVLASALKLTSRYVRDRQQPDKSIDALDLACARAVVDERPEVTIADVAQVVSDWTGIPAGRLSDDEERRYAGMEEVLKARVVGQDPAVDEVSRAVRMALAGLKPARRPIGVFLFLGPTGVGKTRLAKELAAFLFSSENALARFDMNEFQERHSVSTLIGSPTGYVGSEQGGLFSEALRRHPYCVVLLDEIEKAHPDVMNLFLAAFDEGRITDNRGRVIDCSNALFVLTSNLREEVRMGYGTTASAGAAPRRALARHLRPELVNRITEIVTFAALDRKALASILELLLAEKEKALQEMRQITLAVDPAVKELVIDDGFDPQLGARPLERALDTLLMKPLSDALFRGELRPGPVRAVLREGQVAFEPEGGR
jgi:ATP-dependent Clp protease ATP-binding subunit ClpC